MLRAVLLSTIQESAKPPWCFQREGDFEFLHKLQHEVMLGFRIFFSVERLSDPSRFQNAVAVFLLYVADQAIDLRPSPIRA